jgi:hypothetical protein
VYHRVLGGAMSVLHDHPQLSRSELQLALADNDLGQQFERVKLTQLPLGVEEISKLWMVFQTQYRISVAYEVTVVLIDSRKPASAPLPVLKRGDADRGVITAPGSAPALDTLELPRSQPALRLGEDGQLRGTNLTASDATLRFSSTRATAATELVPTPAADTNALAFRILDVPDDAGALARWTPGFYTLALVVKRPGSPPIVSNELAFALAPRIAVSSSSAGPGKAHVNVTCAPRLVDGQRVLLLFGDRQVEPTSITTPPDPTQPTTLVFELTGLDSGSYVVRLRVDGVDSIPVVYTGTPPLPAFDPAQKVSVP